MLLCQVMVRQLQQLQVKSIKAPKYRAKKTSALRVRCCLTSPRDGVSIVLLGGSPWEQHVQSNPNLNRYSSHPLRLLMMGPIVLPHIQKFTNKRPRNRKASPVHRVWNMLMSEHQCQSTSLKGSRPTDVDVHQATLRQWNDRSILRIFPYYPTKVHGCKWINMRKHDWEKTWERCAQVKYHDSPVIGFEINFLEMRKAKVLLLFGCFKSGIAWNSGSNREDVIMCRMV